MPKSNEPMRAAIGISLRRGSPLGARGYVRASAPSLYVRVGTDTDRSPEALADQAATTAADRLRRAQARNAIAAGQLPGVPPRELQVRADDAARARARARATRARGRAESRNGAAR